MTVSVEFLQSGTTEIIPNGGRGVDPIEVTVAMQDLPPHSVSTVTTLFKRRKDGSYTVTGFLNPHQDHFTIEPAQTINIHKTFEWIIVYHDDMRQYKPNGLSVRARRKLAQQNFQPTPEEDAMIHPL